VNTGAALPGGELPAILLAGGRPRDPDAMARVMASAFADKPRPTVAYIGTANGDNPDSFQMISSVLTEAGAHKVTHVRLVKENPDINAARETLTRSDVIFLSGGEVEDGMNWLKKHGLVSFLKNLYNTGKRFMGISAGTIMMGTYWVRWEIPGDDSTSELFDCLGIIPVLFDVHGEDEDWIELKAALKLLGDGSRGYGLPRECVISADSRGTLVNMEKEYLVFANQGGRIRIL
jgi:peptidase E